MPSTIYASSDGIGIVTGNFDPVRYRQYDIWWNTVIAGPTPNTFGATGNDFPGGYFHDVRGNMEHFIFYKGEINWLHSAVQVKDVDGQVVFGIFGGTLDPTLLVTESRPREELPSRWTALRSLIDWSCELLPPAPDTSALPDYDLITANTLPEITDSAFSTTSVDGVTGHLMYVAGTSKAWSDEDVDHLELLAQSDVAWGLSLLQETRSTEQSAWLETLIATIGNFFDAGTGYFSNIFPLSGSSFSGGNVIVSREEGRESTNVWYHTYNHARLAEIALLNDVPWEAQLRVAVDRTLDLGEATAFCFPLFWWVDSGDALNNSDDPGSAGSFAWLMVRGFDLWGDPRYLGAAASALRALHRRKLDDLYGESTLLFRAAWAAHALASRLDDVIWRNVRDDFLAAGLRMMYWRGPHAGMFQACAGICYPALFENVGICLAFDEFLDDTPFPLRQVLGLQLQANQLFFDGQAPGASVPNENLSTPEYPYPGEVGKEIYAAGEVFNLAYLKSRYMGSDSREFSIRNGVTS